LGFVGYEHADGHLLGVGLTVPRDFDFTEELFELLGRHNGDSRHDVEPGMPYLALQVKNPQLQDREIGNLHLKLEERPEGQRPTTLKSASWTRPARVWTTVTPLILRQHPTSGLTAEELVAQACVDAGYPQPAAVRVSLSPLLAGVPHSRAFELKSQQRRPARPLTHAEIEFPVLVRGPVLIGPALCAGYGACRPSPMEERL
jgi:CRISPR-associated protein Csb2